MSLARSRLALALPLLVGCSIYDPSLLAPVRDAGAGDAPYDACTAMCNGKCIDSLRDENNCGACGRACEGTCADGVCAPTVLASSRFGPRGIVVDATSFYITNHGSVSIESGSKTDGAGLSPVVGQAVFPESLVLDGSNLFWTNNSNLLGYVGEIPVFGGKYYTMARDLPNPTALAVDATNFYVATGSPNQSPNCTTGAYVNGIISCSKTNGCFQTGCPSSGGPTVLVTDTVRPSGVAVAGSTLFWTSREGKYLKRCTLPGCSSPETLIAGLGGPTDVRVAGGYVYVADTDGGSVLRCPVSGQCATPKVIANRQADPLVLAVDATSVYFTNFAKGVSGAGTVVRCTLPDCPGGPAVLAKKGNGPWGVTVDEAFVYWVEEGTAGENSTDGQVLRVKK